MFLMTQIMVSISDDTFMTNTGYSIFEDTLTEADTIRSSMHFKGRVYLAQSVPQAVPTLFNAPSKPYIPCSMHLASHAYLAQCT